MQSPRALLSAFRTLATDPQTFFQTHRPANSVGGAFWVVSGVALVSTLAVAAAGAFLASQIDATVTVTTLEPWPDSTCESFEDMEGPVPEACTIDEPRTKQVSVGGKLWDAVVAKLPLVFLATYVGWLLVSVGLHALSAFTDGNGSFMETLAVTGWATALDLVSVAFGAVGLALAVQGVDFGGDPQALAAQLQRAAGASTGVVGALGTLLAVGWQAYIWTYGLHEAHDASVSGAAFVSGIAAFALLVATLL
jgi:hypothetical protein